MDITDPSGGLLGDLRCCPKIIWEAIEYLLSEVGCVYQREPRLNVLK
jgi:hypothetical protein